MFSKSPSDVVPRTGKGIGAKKTTATISLPVKIVEGKQPPKRSEIQTGLLYLGYSSRARTREKEIEKEEGRWDFHLPVNHSKVMMVGKSMKISRRKALVGFPHPPYFLT
jgi:hypothetical protein